MKSARVCIAAVSLFFLFPSDVFAQQEQEKESKWGLNFSFDPRWRVPSSIGELFEKGAKEVDIQGREFRLGFLRGRTFSGDWGVSFVRKEFSNDSLIDKSFIRENEVYPNFRYFRDVSLTGVEIHKYFPFATIKNRVQFGLNVASGAAVIKGKLEDRFTSSVFDPTIPNPDYAHLPLCSEVLDIKNPPQSPIQCMRVFLPGFAPTPMTCQFVPPIAISCTSINVQPHPSQFKKTEGISETDAKKMFGNRKIPVFPLFNFQAVAAFIPVRGFKIKAASGINFPGYQSVEISLLYFFGSK